ncbi:MAG: DUF4870 domain-containing protein [Nocardioides sp.]|nr:DUF4870 domain-containing protein [Nocardioides sp.]
MTQSPEPPVDPTTPTGQQPPAPPPQVPAYGSPPERGAPQSWTAPPVPGQLTPDEKTWGCAAHWSAFVAAFVALAFLGPLIVMLTKGNESAYVRRQAVEALSFQLTMLLYIVVSLTSILLLVGLVLAPIVGLAWLVLTLIGTIKSANGEEYRYPLTIRVVS